MYIRDDIRIVTLGDIKFYHNNGPLPRFQFDPDAIVGWDDGANVKRNASARPLTDGDFPEPGALEAKLITLTGTAVAATPEQLHTMRDQFTGLFQLGQYRQMSLANKSGTRWMTVGLGGSSSWVQILDTAANFKIDLYAPDPLQYGVWRETQITSPGNAGVGLSYPLTYAISFGTVTRMQNVIISNEGNYPSWPIFTVRGDYPSGFTLRGPSGREVAYSGLVSHSAPVRIDFAQGFATVNGQDRSYMLTKRNWFSIPPKGSIQPLFLPAQEGDGWCEVEYRNTWA